MTKIENLKTRFRKAGFGLIEIVVATALIAGSLFALATISRIALRASSENLFTVKAAYLAEEAMEAARSIRDDGWTANMSVLTTGQIYYPVFASSVWTLSTSTPGLIDGAFDRQVVFEDVYRRTSDDNIVPESSPDDKYLDSDTLKVRASIFWVKSGGGATTTYELVNYLSNIFLD